MDLANLDEDNGDDKDSSLQLKDSPSPCCYFNIRKWKHGCCTLLHDVNSYGREFALDAFIHFNCEGMKLLLYAPNLFHVGYYILKINNRNTSTRRKNVQS